MRNTYIAAGEDDEKEMIATMGEGLFARKMGGGSVNPVTGEFNFAVAEGYWVKDGKIQRPVRGATLVGRGAQVLQRIDRVGREMTLAEGMCGFCQRVDPGVRRAAHHPGEPHDGGRT